MRAEDVGGERVWCVSERVWCVSELVMRVASKCGV